jgi:hypothetical protein
VKTQLLLTASAIVMGVAGVAGLFAPAEIARMSGLAPVSGASLLIQLLAALLFAFAMVNWMARGSLMGGIYNRPIAVGNVTHFVIGALTLTKALAAGERRMAVVIAAAVYVVFALAFGLTLLSSPVKRQADN